MADEIINTETEQVDTETVEETLISESKEEEAGEEKEAGEAKEKKELPENYEIKLEEGMEIDQALLEAFTPVFKELGMTNESVQKLAETFAPWVQKRDEDARQLVVKEYKDMVEGWKNETIKQLGADNQKQLAIAAKARDKFATKEFIEMVNETGVGNHPEMVKFLIRIGKTISEDSFKDGTPSQKPDILKVMYPTMK